jgi:hypothetical protein
MTENTLQTPYIAKITPEEIAKNYYSALDSVNLINAGKQLDMSVANWEDALKRNQEHLKIMINKDYWTTEDLQVFKSAIGE